MTTRPAERSTSLPRSAARVLLGAFMTLAGVGHLTFQRQEFQAQVPTWLPVDRDAVVLGSGVLEVAFGLAMLSGRRRRTVGLALAAFFVLIFPGNVSQYVSRQSAFGLDTDQKRLTRLFFQPVLVAWALWSTGALHRSGALGRTGVGDRRED